VEVLLLVTSQQLSSISPRDRQTAVGQEVSEGRQEEPEPENHHVSGGLRIFEIDKPVPSVTPSRQGIASGEITDVAYIGHGHFRAVWSSIWMFKRRRAVDVELIPVLRGRSKPGFHAVLGFFTAAGLFKMFGRFGVFSWRSLAF
jgi:hypothetical protein